MPYARQKDETVNHLLGECPKLALHWELCGQYEFERSDKWYEHSPENVKDNDKCKLLWDFSMQTDKKLDHNRPNIVLVDKQSKSCLIIDVTCPNDWRVESK